MACRRERRRGKCRGARHAGRAWREEGERDTRARARRPGQNTRNMRREPRTRRRRRRTGALRKHSWEPPPPLSSPSCRHGHGSPGTTTAPPRAVGNRKQNSMRHTLRRGGAGEGCAVMSTALLPSSSPFSALFPQLDLSRATGAMTADRETKLGLTESHTAQTSRSLRARASARRQCRARRGSPCSLTFGLCARCAPQVPRPVVLIHGLLFRRTVFRTTVVVRL